MIKEEITCDRCKKILKNWNYVASITHRWNGLEIHQLHLCESCNKDFIRFMKKVKA